MLNEHFVSIQGEGPSTGHPATFIRFAGCNLKCAWCDTPYAQKKDGGVQITAEELARKVIQGPQLCVFTGGEPMLYQETIQRVIALCAPLGHRFEIETNGTIGPKNGSAGEYLEVWTTRLPRTGPNWEHQESGVTPVLRMVFSPKFEWVKQDYMREDFVWARNYTIKAPVRNRDEVQALEIWLKKLNLSFDDVWLMPLGTTASKIRKEADWLIQAAIEFGFKVSFRTHVLLWDNKRGV